ncbi:MAG: pyridoxal phosphate-dependent aminotransferase [Spirochaetaceae bacterium]
MAASEKIKEFMEKSSWIRRMFEAGAKLKAEHGAENVFDFSLGNPNVPPPPSFQRALTEAVREEAPNKHGYMPNAGYPEVRQTVAEFVSRRHGADVTAGEIVMTVGAGGGLNAVIKALVDPGDEVLAMVPYFVEYGFYADNHGATLTLAPTAETFDLDIEAIEGKITPKTAVVIINSPNNPTGAVYPARTLAALGELLERKSRELGRTIYLVSDEPYAAIVYDGAEVPSVFAHYRNSIVVTSYSKDLSIPGERIGYAAVHPELDDHDDVIGGIILCNRILGFVNAPAIMQRVVAKLQGETVDIGEYARKRRLICDGLRELGYDFVEPAGTFYLMPKAPGGDDVAFVQALQKELVLGVPGSGFGLPGHFRLSFCVSDDTITGAMPGFERAIARFR